MSPFDLAKIFNSLFFGIYGFAISFFWSRGVRFLIIPGVVAALFLLLGVLSNFLVFRLNNQQMPISRIVLARLGFQPLSDKYRVIDEETKLWWLGDILYIPAGRDIISIGDFLMFLAPWVGMICLFFLIFV